MQEVHRVKLGFDVLKILVVIPQAEPQKELHASIETGFLIDHKLIEFEPVELFDGKVEVMQPAEFRFSDRRTGQVPDRQQHLTHRRLPFVRFPGRKPRRRPGRPRTRSKRSIRRSSSMTGKRNRSATARSPGSTTKLMGWTISFTTVDGDRLRPEFVERHLHIGVLQLWRDMSRKADDSPLPQRRRAVKKQRGREMPRGRRMPSCVI